MILFSNSIARFIKQGAPVLFKQHLLVQEGAKTLSRCNPKNKFFISGKCLDKIALIEASGQICVAVNNIKNKKLGIGTSNGILVNINYFKFYEDVSLNTPLLIESLFVNATDHFAIYNINIRQKDLLVASGDLKLYNGAIEKLPCDHYAEAYSMNNLPFKNKHSQFRQSIRRSLGHITIEENQIQAKLCFSDQEAFFSGHFIDNPIVPSVMFIKSVKELIDMAFNRTYEIKSITHAQFIKPASPQMVMFVSVQIESMTPFLKVTAVFSYNSVDIAVINATFIDKNLQDL